MSQIYTVNSRVAIVDKEGRPTAQVVQVFTQLTRLLGGNGYLPLAFYYVPPNAVAHGTVFLNDEAQIESTPAMADGQLLIGVTGGSPALGSVSGTANQIDVANGAGSITLSTPQDIHNGASPTFAGITLSSLVPHSFGYVSAGGLIESTAQATDGQILVGVTGADPVAATITGTANQIAVTNAAGSITLSTPQDIAPASNVTFNALTLTNGFGCNGASPQTEYTVNGAVVGAAGAAYTATEQGIINNLVTLVNQLRAALVANGIAV